MPESDNPYFTIVINVFNGERYLKNAIQSVLGQTFKDFELVIWDNCSTDETPSIISFFASMDSRVRVFRSSEHTSLYSARNAAVTKSLGSFIAFLDADDYWREDKLAVCKASLVWSGALMFYSNHFIVRGDDPRGKEAYFVKLPSGCIGLQTASNYAVAMSSLVVSREHLLQLSGPFNPTYNIIGDFDLVLRFVSQHKSQASDEPLVFYRVHGKSLSRNPQLSLFREVSHWLESGAASSELGVQVFKRAAMTLLLNCLLSAPTSTLRQKEELWKHLNQNFSFRWLFEKFTWILGNLLRRVARTV